MAITGTDSYGSYIDTGVGTAPVARPTTEDEFHASGEIDSGSKNTIAQTVASHVSHRVKGSPR